jgi:AbrB family looped-hinge helix DNA binding protein
MRITSKGQVTIPQAVRERTGLLPNTDVDFVVEGDSVQLVKAGKGKRPTRGARAVRRLREGGRHIRMTTDEIMALTRADP